MAWNDLDIDVENDKVDMHSIYEIMQYVIKTFSPIWFEGKECIMNGKKCYFIGFETKITNDLWNIDIWFLDNEEIERSIKYNEEINKKITHELKKTIVTIKRELINQGLYGGMMYHSIDVYDAVINYGIKTIEEMKEKYKK